MLKYVMLRICWYVVVVIVVVFLRVAAEVALCDHLIALRQPGYVGA